MLHVYTCAYSSTLVTRDAMMCNDIYCANNHSIVKSTHLGTSRGVKSERAYAQISATLIIMATKDNALTK